MGEDVLMMEGRKDVGENGYSIKENEKPPNPLSSSYTQGFGHGHLTPPCRPSLVRHASLIKIREDSGESRGASKSEFIPIVRSGGWADIGSRQSMEDVHVCVDDFLHDYDGREHFGEGPGAFYGVFDGHGGKHAADFVCKNLPRLILEETEFPREIEKALTSAFLQTDNAFAEACALDSALASGTTALAALVLGRSLVVANAGDCRAVLSHRGKAIDLSRDHKPGCAHERCRIEASGGFVSDDGYLNAQLNVARALGDWHLGDDIKRRRPRLLCPSSSYDSGSPFSCGPLSAEPETSSTLLTEEDEFLIIGCDGIWEVFRSQNAVDFARRRLMEHNDPRACSRELVVEALKRRSGDNLSVVVVCFHHTPPPSLVAGPVRSRVQRSISAEGLRELQSCLDALGS
ncbi:hypothetical protein AMTRI_Chr05g64040 [Amborella trichopoda]|uniref:protein-serine/threonine phosphatase n=1 Tax=Amborella trichopoda TaxID=13333 RepID=W1NPR6_AMBTC|nr:probable protein phosphatase 2C 57 [Amborella trichopoda]ERM97065.1 hypothetical protein AMTR_s00122p00108900 [Amborella trichopoda]|eukprot:XP_006829649.1 probable protein phosphatase 2C 57 [Amborella trichopoda]